MLTKVLMCKPTYFDVTYKINPWMKPGTVDINKANQQWQKLVKAYESKGIGVEIIEQEKGLPDMVFAADQGLVVTKNNQKKLVLSNFKYPERQKESSYYTKWFERNGFEIEELDEKTYFEGGGELILWNKKYFIGEGFRNSSLAYKQISQKFDLDFIPLELVDERFYHLDTCFFVLNSDTVFYYPPAFSKKSQKEIKKYFKNAIKFSEKEVLGFAANSVISGKTVFVQDGNPTFVKKLQQLDYETIEIDLSEFMKAGGGIHCLTFELERQPHFDISFRQKKPILATKNR